VTSLAMALRRQKEIILLPKLRSLRIPTLVTYLECPADVRKAIDGLFADRSRR
jgi:hypothetical protein